MSAPPPAVPDPIATATAFLDEAHRATDAWLDGVMPAAEGPVGRLAEAMRYSVFAGGKRLRPALVLAACRAVGGEDEAALPFAGAVELLHTYSLIHDDLPAMDDDDLRRGRPTSHVMFGEALAILAGDALHTLSFEVILDHVPDDVLARRLGLELARASGFAGMVGGQVLDLSAAEDSPDEERLMRIQGGKTAALLAASCCGGALAGGGSDAEVESARRFGRHLGFAFQMVDDVLDVTGTADVLGKTPGKDAAEHRMTWVAYEGVDAAMARAEREIDSALRSIEALPGGELLQALALFVTRRDR